MVGREEFCFACGLLKRNGDDVATADGDHSSILLVCDKLRCRSSEPCCQHTVIRARRAATLIMPGHGDSRLLAESFFYLIGYLIRNRGMLGVFKLFAAFLLGKQPVINRSPGLQEFDIKLIDTVDLEGGPGTFLLFNEFGQCVLLMCSVSLSLIGMSISITDRDSR